MTIQNKILQKTVENWNMRNASQDLPSLHEECPVAYAKFINAADDIINGVREMLTNTKTHGEVRSMIAGALYSTFMLGNSYSSRAIRTIAGDIENLCMPNESVSKMAAYEKGEVKANEDDEERKNLNAQKENDAKAILRSLGVDSDGFE